MADNTGLFGDGMMGGYGNNITAANIIRSRYRQPIAQAAMENADTGSIRVTPPTKFESWLNESGQRLMNPTDTIAQGVQNFTQQDPVDMGMSLLNGGMGGALGATVWHGSPHSFKAFDAAKIGTGEGAQAFGHGLYVAENPNVAESYKNAGIGGVDWERATYGGRKIQRLYDNAQQAQDAAYRIPDKELSKAAADKANAELYYWESVLTGTHPNIIKSNAMAEEGWPGMQQFVNNIDNTKFKNIDFPDTSLYKVDLPDEHIAKMLDWDKPLSQQTTHVQAAIRKQMPDNAWEVMKDRTGQDYISHYLDAGIQNQRGGAQQSAEMSALGIPGIKYLDATSRSKPMSASALSANKIYDDLMGSPGTSNYVVFPGNEDILTILERNNQPLVNALRSK